MTVNDIYDAVVKEFNDAVSHDAQLQNLLDVVNNGGRLTAQQLIDMSTLTAQHISNAIYPYYNNAELDGEILTEMIETVVAPTLGRVQQMVGVVTQKSIKNLNKTNGIGLNAVDGTETERVRNLVDKMATYGDPHDAAWLTDNDVIENLMRTTVDTNIRANVNAMERSGRKIWIERKTSGRENCEYCKNLVYSGRSYDAPDGVWSRHRGCDCTLDYWDKNGRREIIY